VRFPSKFNFRPRFLPPEAWHQGLRQRWQELGKRPWLRSIGSAPWLLPVAVAVGAHALWLAGSTVAERPRRPVTSLRAADNTPELLRFSTRASQAASPASGLGTLTLPFENSLPPPPPELLGSLPPPPPPAAGGQSQRQHQAPREGSAALASRRPVPTGLAWGVNQSLSPGLPSDASTALELASQLDAPSEPAGESGKGEKGEKGETPAKPDGAVKAEASKIALNALAARHLKLSASADRPYTILWDSGTAAGSRPAGLASLPEGVEVRRLPLAAARAMGLSQPHAITVNSPAGLLLLWVQGDDLWLIRRSPPSAANQ